MIPCSCWDDDGDGVSAPIIPAPSPSISLRSGHSHSIAIRLSHSHSLSCSSITCSIDIAPPLRCRRPSVLSPSPSQQPQGIILSFDLFYVVFGLSLCFREMGCWFCLFSISYVLFFFFLGVMLSWDFLSRNDEHSQFYWNWFLYIEIDFNKLSFYV